MCEPSGNCHGLMRLCSDGYIIGCTGHVATGYCGVVCFAIQWGSWLDMDVWATFCCIVVGYVVAVVALAIWEEEEGMGSLMVLLLYSKGTDVLTEYRTAGAVHIWSSACQFT